MNSPIEPTTIPHIEPTWVDTNDALRDCCDALRGANKIAVDTEFMRTSTFYPKAALFQLFAGEHAQGKCFLVDPLPISDFSPLVELLSDPAVVKIFHACSEDLDVFNSFLGCVPEPLIDTQIAAGMLSYGSSTSYAASVEAVLEVKLEKGETRSDWLRRPLQAKQLQYAVQDVTYLLPLYERLMEELDQMKRLPWLHEDCESLVAAAKMPLDLHAFYPRIKSAWKLSRQELAVLKALSFWRETQSRELDLPRNHVLHERVLWSLAKWQPQSLEALRGIEELDGRKIKRFGQELLGLIAGAAALEADSYPEPLPAPLPINERKLVKLLKDAIARKADELQVLPEVLAKKADYEFLVRFGRLSERLQGWRREVIGESLLQIVAGAAGQQSDQLADQFEGNRSQCADDKKYE
ncbi:MAG: ribonuclease D [Cellvibrionaceae bacterium]